MPETPVTIAFTSNYFVPAATMLLSLLNESSGSFKVICLVTDEIPQRMKDELVGLGKGRMTFDYIPLKGRLQGFYTDPRYTEAASYRLLLPEILPEYDTIVYIDCDVIVRQDVGRLYQTTSLGDNYLGVVYEAPIEKQAERIQSLGCAPRQYFNSGFLIMNLAAMRRKKLTDKLLDSCKVDYLEFPDQDALNQVCQGHVLALSPVHNSIRTFFLPQYKSDFVQQYSLEMWELVQAHGSIHYTGGKPWNTVSIKFGEWWRTYYRLPQAIRNEWKPNVFVKMIGYLYRSSVFEAFAETIRSLFRIIMH
jgi:lipopolysaccharide biosynthesis glycosyltransferase